MKVKINSKINDCMGEPEGKVDPNMILEGNKNFNVKLAANAPKP